MVYIPNISLPAWLIILMVGVPLILDGCLLIILAGLRKWAPEAWIIKDARKKDLPILDQTDIGTGFSEMILGEKDEKGDIRFENEKFGIKLDPALLSSDVDPRRYKKGLVILNYATTGWLPQGIKNILGLDRVTKIRKGEKYAILKFLTDEDLIQLLDTNQEQLVFDVPMFIEKYEAKYHDPLTNSDVGVPKEPIIKLINEMRAELATDEIDKDFTTKGIYKGGANVRGAFFSLNAAFKNNPYGLTAQHLQHFEILTRLKERKKSASLVNVLTYGIVIIGIIVAGAIAYKIIGG